MAEKLKFYYNESFFDDFLGALQEIEPSLDAKCIRTDILAPPWADLELKERMRHISQALAQHLTGPYADQLAVLIELTTTVQARTSGMSFLYMFVPDFIELYGITHFEASIAAMEKITTFASCEFAVRPFLLQYPQRMMAQMQAWTQHEHEGVRRFASEGCRPRLPWAMAIPALKADPTPILPVLEALKDDDSEFVRKSVANNLNDISKDHPRLVIDLARQWLGKTDRTDWVAKHGCRTLLKQGNPTVMHMFGFADPDDLRVDDLRLHAAEVTVGNDLEFSFRIKNSGAVEVQVRLEYAIYYLRSNGKHARKVFKISERSLAPGVILQYERRQHFKPISTRRYYGGTHRMALIVNGHEGASHAFEVKLDNEYSPPIYARRKPSMPLKASGVLPPQKP